MRYRDGVIMAGDRQATAGFQVASRRMEKIFKSDDLSGHGHRRARPGPAMEMAKLFQTELEHYEKVEGDNLSLDGKANKPGPDGPDEPAGRPCMGLARGCRSSPASTRRPAWAASSSTTSRAAATRRRDYDAAGLGLQRTRAIPSRSCGGATCRATRPFACRAWRRSSTPPTRTWAPGGPISVRGIFPTVKTITASGSPTWPTTRSASVCEAILADRARRPATGA